MSTDAPSLDALFRPRSVAVVGASRHRGSIGGEILHNLLACGFEGAVYPVNPKASVVQSVRAYPSVAAIPDPVDLAVIVVPSAQVPVAIDDCIAKGVHGVVVISAGFAEIGSAGRERQAAILERCRAHGIRMVGPNCLGLVNTDPVLRLNATFAPTWPPAGEVSFSSQSGALGLVILETAGALGIGVRHFVSVGNKADVSGNDLLEYWENDPDTKVILLYLESFGNPSRFMQIARRVARKKPIVAVKSGRTEAGARAASSHTGSLAGVDIAVDALLGQAGVIRTDTMEQLFDMAMLLANQPVPLGHRVGIITNAGGPGIMASDACESRGLTIPAPDSDTRRALRTFLPAEASVNNPIDMVASASGESYERAVQLMLADANIDALMVIFVPPVVTEAAAVAEAIQRAAHGSSKPVVTCFMGTHGIPAALTTLRKSHFPSYAFPEAAAIALARAVRYGAWLRRPEGSVPELAGIEPARARRAVHAACEHAEAWLSPTQVTEVLAAYGIRTPPTQLVTSADAAAEAAATVGFPVALKLASNTITHKSEVGGVALGLESAAEVARAYDAMQDRLRQSGQSDAMQGAVVQPMLPRGVETFVGMTLDPAFGPLLAFGIGGINVELWRDVVFRVHPITDVDAHQMLSQIRGVKLLEGFRGGPPADREALADVLLRVSRMVEDLSEVVEIDINPLLALQPGEGAIALDCRIRARPVAQD